MALPSYIQQYFWDINASKANPQKHQKYFIERILELGDKKAVAWIERTYGKQKIKQVAKKARLSPKSKNYWKIVL